MQFARKAGKLVSGMDTCERALKHKSVRVLVLAEDSSARTKTTVKRKLESSLNPVTLIETGTQEELAQALGLPVTAVFGISDKNIAAKMEEYWRSEA